MSYTAVHRCEVCAEPFHFTREVEEVGALYLMVGHDHTEDPPVWRASVYPHLPKQRYPESYKTITLIHKENKAKAREKAQIKKAER